MDEVAASERATMKERTLVGLITLTSNIIQSADQEICDRIIQEKNLINLIFKDFLFMSYYQAQEDKNNGFAKKEIKLVQR